MEGLDRKLDLTVVTTPTSSVEEEITTLLHRTTEARGHPALSEQKRLALLQASESGAPSGDGHLFVGVIARQTGRPGLSGYAQIDGNASKGVYAVELVVDPASDDRSAIADVLLDASIAEVRSRSGGTLRYWAAKALPGDDARASAHGLRIERDLVQMRCPLPVSDDLSKEQGATVSTRPFRPRVDETAWLASNNRAFAEHPEQGQWELARLVEREKEPWFDPAGFLLLEDDERIAGSCWTKVHAGTDPPMGEIYVISIDPDYQGRGWGRALTLAGLDWLAGRGLRTGMLYVDARNRQATAMYRSMGFSEHHVDRAYVGTV